MRQCHLNNIHFYYYYYYYYYYSRPHQMQYDIIIKLSFLKPATDICCRRYNINAGQKSMCCFLYSETTTYRVVSRRTFCFGLYLTSTVRRIHRRSCIFRSCIFHLCNLVLHFQVLHFPPMQFGPPFLGPPFLGPAFSGPAFSAPPFPVRVCRGAHLLQNC